MRVALLASLGLVVFAPSLAQAQNLVVNPGFETGDFTGWTITGSTASVQLGDGHTGLYAASFGAAAPNVDDLRQSLSTTTGQQYTLTFFAQTPELNIPPGHPNSLSVYFNGSLVDGPLTVPDNPGFEQYSYTITATSTASLLRFVISNTPDYTQLDDVSVTAITNAATPEPGSIALLTSSILSGAGFLVRRQRRAYNAD